MHCLEVIIKRNQSEISGGSGAPPDAAISPGRRLERALILANVAACDSCGAVAPFSADADPAWFIDMETYVDGKSPYQVAIIRCPRCW